MTTENQQNASGEQQAEQPVQTPAAPPTEPKVEVKDGKVLVDGKEYVPNSDLIAAKKSLQGEMEKAQATHNSAIDQARTELSRVQQQLAQANAEMEKTKAAQATEGGATAPKADEQPATPPVDDGRLSQLEQRNIELQKKLLLASYNIPADSDIAKSLDGKTAEQLQAFEEALKTVGGRPGAGPGAGMYALGGGNQSVTPQTPMDRAKQLINNTPYRGVRNAQVNQQ